MSMDVSAAEGGHLALVPACAEVEGDSLVAMQGAEGARFALAALACYGAEVGAVRTASVRELMSDMIADLMHLADRSNVVFDDVVAAASASYLLDVRGPRVVALALPPRSA